MTRTSSIALVLLAFLFCSAASFAGTLTIDCTENANANPPILCPGAPQAALAGVGKANFDEVTPGISLQNFTFVTTIGDLVFCEGKAKADNSACDNGVGFSDILQFTLNKAGTETNITFLSDIATSDSDKVDQDGNGADIQRGSLTPSAAGPNFFIEEPSVKDAPFGVEKVIYKAISGAGEIDYTIYSDNPEPSTLLLFASGAAAFAIGAIVRLKRNARRPI